MFHQYVSYVYQGASETKNVFYDTASMSKSKASTLFFPIFSFWMLSVFRFALYATSRTSRIALQERCQGTECFDS